MERRRQLLPCDIPLVKLVCQGIKRCVMRDEYYFLSVLVDVINFLCGLHNYGNLLLLIVSCFTRQMYSLLVNILYKGIGHDCVRISIFVGSRVVD